MARNGAGASMTIYMREQEAENGDVGDVVASGVGDACADAVVLGWAAGCSVGRRRIRWVRCIRLPPPPAAEDA